MTANTGTARQRTVGSRVCYGSPETGQCQQLKDTSAGLRTVYHFLVVAYTPRSILFQLKLYFWIKVFEFTASIVNSKLPINAFLVDITISVPSSERLVEFINAGYSFS